MKDSNPKKILITGVAGFIGSHFLEHILVNTDWDVVGIASWTHKGVPERITESTHYQRHKHRVEIITHDLVAPFPVQTIKKMGKIDYIANFAAESHVERSIIDPVPFVKNNVAVALTMLELARELKPESFIQISTDEVYGPANTGEHPEWDTQLPSNPYSASKSAQEAIAISYWRTYGVPVVITNTMNNFAETQDGEKFIPMVIKRIISGETVPVHGTEGHVGSRFYLHARNHADAVLFILRNLPPASYREDGAQKPDRYNIVGDKEINNLEMAQLIAKLLGKELKFEYVDFHKTRPGHDRRYGLDGSKLRNLGWNPPVDFEASMRRYVEWTLRDENKHWL